MNGVTMVRVWHRARLHQPRYTLMINFVWKRFANAFHASIRWFEMGKLMVSTVNGTSYLFFLPLFIGLSFRYFIFTIFFEEIEVWFRLDRNCKEISITLSFLTESRNHSNVWSLYRCTNISYSLGHYPAPPFHTIIYFGEGCDQIKFFFLQKDTRTVSRAISNKKHILYKFPGPGAILYSIQIIKTIAATLRSPSGHPSQSTCKVCTPNRRGARCQRLFGMNQVTGTGSIIVVMAMKEVTFFGCVPAPATTLFLWRPEKIFRMHYRDYREMCVGLKTYPNIRFETETSWIWMGLEQQSRNINSLGKIVRGGWDTKHTTFGVGGILHATAMAIHREAIIYVSLLYSLSLLFAINLKLLHVWSIKQNHYLRCRGKVLWVGWHKGL